MTRKKYQPKANIEMTKVFFLVICFSVYKGSHYNTSQTESMPICTLFYKEENRFEPVAMLPDAHLRNVGMIGKP